MINFLGLQGEKGAQVLIVPELVDYMISSLDKVKHFVLDLVSEESFSCYICTIVVFLDLERLHIMFKYHIIKYVQNHFVSSFSVAGW